MAQSKKFNSTAKLQKLQREQATRMQLDARLKPRTNLTKSTEKEETGEAYHRTPCGRSSIVEERSESKLGFPTHAPESKHLQRQTKAKHTCAHRSQDH